MKRIPFTRRNDDLFWRRNVSRVEPKMEKNLSLFNFEFLAVYDPQILRLGFLAERYFRDDPNTCLIKLRQLGELFDHNLSFWLTVLKIDE